MKLTKKSINLKVIAVIGPTSSGKSELAVKLAKRFNGEVISADSRQVYRGLNIGTGKIPLKKIRGALYYKGIRHHLLDVASPKRQFTVAQYQTRARAAIADILRRGKLPILCGGTGLYVDAALYDFPIPVIKPNQKLRKKLERCSTKKLFFMLMQRDPRRARAIDRHNRRRLIRALEIIEATGEKIPKLDAYYRHPRYDVLKIGILVPPEKLKRAIALRLARRIRVGMIAEVKKLLARKQITPERLETLGLEYRYIGRYLASVISKTRMTDTLEKESWRYAKRQMTWFRRDASTRWISNPQPATSLTQSFLRGAP